jgi:hypothetical protein
LRTNADTVTDFEVANGFGADADYVPDDLVADAAWVFSWPLGLLVTGK